MRKKKTTTRGRSGESVTPSMDERVDEGSVIEDLGPPAGFERARLSFGKTEELIRMKVMRVTQDGSEESLQTFEFDPETHNEDFLRDRFGAGRYRLRFLGADWGYKMVMTVRVGDIPGAGPVDDPGVSSGTFDPLPYFMREAEKSREQFNTMVLAMLSKAGDGGGNEALVALIKAQSEQNTALLEKLVNRPSGSSDGVDTVMKALELGMSAVADIKVDSDGGWVSALRGVAKDLGPVLSQLMAQRQPGSPPVPPSGAPVDARVPPSALPPPTSSPPDTASSPQSADVFRGLLTRYAPIALQVAKEGQPPTEFAGQLLDSIGVNLHPLFDSLQANDLVSLQPELGSVMWKNPVDGTETRWIDEVVQLLHTRDWGVEDEESTEEGA